MLLLLSAGGCKSPEQAVVEVGVRAYFIDKKDLTTVKNRGIQLGAQPADVIRLITDVYREKFDSDANVISAEGTATNERNPAFSKPIFKIITPPIKSEDNATFIRNFRLGEYILDRPGYKVVPEDFQYSIDAIISLNGQNLNIEFRANGYVEWNIYKQSKNGDWSPERESLKPYYGVGSYRFQKDQVETLKNGKTKRTTVWDEVDVNDRPKTLGQLESELVNATIELAALRGFKAIIVNIY